MKHKKMKLRVQLKFLKAAVDGLERHARRIGMFAFVAESTRRKIRSLRIDRPTKRRARHWTKSKTRPDK